MTDLKDSLEKKLEEKEKEKAKTKDHQIWEPKEGEILKGKVIKLGKTITSFGEKEYLEIQTREGQVWTVFVTAVLKDRLEEEKVKEGDTIAIKFLGLKKSKKSRKSYKDFVVATGPP